MTDEPAARAVPISPEIAAIVDGAFDKHVPILIAHVDEGGVPRMTFRGSTHVHGPGALALWARHRDGGLVRSIAARPKVTLLYRDPETRTTLYFYGRASAVTEPAVAQAIYDASPEPERNADADRLGCGVVVALDRIEGRLAGEPYEAGAS